VTVADDLARAFDEELVVLHVLPRDRFERRKKERPDYYADVAAQDAANVADDVVDATLDDASNVTVKGLIGEPAAEVLEWARERDARFIVVGGRRRTPAGKALFGSTTQSILLGAETPVVTVMHE
jgi:nucleotide-binding universal stress UspA family protein